MAPGEENGGATCRRRYAWSDLATAFVVSNVTASATTTVMMISNALLLLILTCHLCPFGILAPVGGTVAQTSAR